MRLLMNAQSTAARQQASAQHVTKTRRALGANVSLYWRRLEANKGRDYQISAWVTLETGGKLV